MIQIKRTIDLMNLTTLKKQRGVGKIVIVIGIVVLLVAIGGGYTLLGKSGVSLPGASLPLNPNCKFNDPDLCKFINNFKVLGNYSVKSTSTPKTGPKVDSLFEIAGEDKSRIVLSENSKETYNVITIGDTTYTKDFADNKWWKQVAKAEKTNSSLDIRDEFKKTETAEDKTSYKKVVKEACGSRNCFKYEVIDPANTDSTEFIWFDDREYLLRKTRSESKGGEVTEAEYSYDKVNISAPSPTKDATADQIIVPNGASIPGISKEDLNKLQKEAEEFQKTIPQNVDYNSFDTEPDDSEQ